MATRRPTTQPVKGRTTTPRTPGAPDPDSSDSANNAGIPGSNVSTEHAANLVAQSEREVMSPAVRQVKTTMPLKGSADEHTASLEARVAESERVQAEMREQMRGVMEANRQLLAMARRSAVDMPKATELPDLKDVQAKHDAGKLERATLTKDGWVVPRVTTDNPEQQTTAALISALRKGVSDTDIIAAEQTAARSMREHAKG